VGDSPVVADLMRTDVMAVTPDMPVADAAERMVTQKVGSACVMAGSFLCGILTERDVLRAAASGADLTISTVNEWMTPDPQSAGPETSAEDAAQIMFRNGFRHLPVLDGKHVCGIVSLRDLFAARIRRPARRD
jgi:CBS domain-containing protein